MELSGIPLNRASSACRWDPAWATAPLATRPRDWRERVRAWRSVNICEFHAGFTFRPTNQLLTQSLGRTSQLKTLMRPLRSRDESSPVCHLLATCTGLSRSCALSRDPTTVSVRPGRLSGAGDAGVGAGARRPRCPHGGKAGWLSNVAPGDRESRAVSEAAGGSQGRVGTRRRARERTPGVRPAPRRSASTENPCPGPSQAPRVTAPESRLRSLRPELLVCQALRACVRALRSDAHPPGRDVADAWAPGAGSSDAEPSFPICRRDGHTRGPEGRRGGRPQAVSRGVDAAWWKRELAVASGSR